MSRYVFLFSIVAVLAIIFLTFGYLIEKPNKLNQKQWHIILYSDGKKVKDWVIEKDSIELDFIDENNKVMITGTVSVVPLYSILKTNEN